MNRKSTRLTFPGARGDRLAAYLDHPGPSPVAFALLAHCFTCSKDLKSLVRLSTSLVERGIAVLRFDFTGLGESEGDFADTHFSSNIEDLVAAADYLREHHEAPKLLVGHSLGGAAVLVAADRIPEVLAVATLGAPSDPSHLRDAALADVDPEAAESEVELAGRKFRVRRELFEDLAQHSVLEKVAGLDRALLVMHSPVDRQVSIDHARRIYEAARHPKSFLSLDGADHLLLGNPGDARWAGEMLACWAMRYLEPEASTSAVADAPLSEGVVEVVGGREHYPQRVRAGDHLWRADEPASLGGSDTGPTPYQLLLSSLGSCVAITLRMYADRKEIPLEGVRIRLRHSKIHATDCEECESEEGRIDRIEEHLELIGDDLTEHQRDRLLEISKMCPVHRTLTSETTIRPVEAFD